MTSVHLNSVKRKIGTSVLRTLWVTLVILAASAQSALASPRYQSKKVTAKVQTVPLPEGDDVAEVHWLKTTYRQIDNQHARVLLVGTADPGVRIELKPGAMVMRPLRNARKIEIKEMAPSSKEVTVGTSRHFRLLLTLPFGHVQIPFVAKNPPLLPQPYVIVLSLKKNKGKKIVYRRAYKKHSKLKFGIELRSVAYTQTNLNNLHETMLAATAAYELALARRWHLKARSFVDALNDMPFSSSQNNFFARYVGFNSDLIYSFPKGPRKWSLGVAGGLYYITMFSSGMTFGFHNLWGPELYPTIRFSFNRKNMFDLYFKYAPVYVQGSLSFSSHESGLGLEWTRRYADKRSISVKLELLQDKFVNSYAATNSSAVNLGVSFGIP